MTLAAGALSVILPANAGVAPRRPPTFHVATLPVTAKDDIRFKHLSTEEGLSQSTVLEIVQDSNGFMWFGTHVGLNRFDGYTFKIYKHETGNPNSLGGTYVTALLKDHAGMLWIGVDNTLDRFDPNTEKFKHYGQDRNRSEGPSGSVVSICEDRQGFIWVATSSGLDRLDPKFGHFTHYRHDPARPGTLDSDDVRAVLVDHGGTLWVATSAGLNELPPRESDFSHLPWFQKTPPARSAGNMGIYEDHLGTIWLTSAMGNGLAALDRNSLTFTVYNFRDAVPENSRATGVDSLVEDRDGTLWVGTVGGGILKLDRKAGLATRYRTNSNVSESLSNNFESFLYQDREGNLWAGTGGGGVDWFSSQPSPFTRYKHGISGKSLDQNFILSAYEDSQKVLWVGNDSVLNRVELKTGRVTFFRHRQGIPNSISSGSVTSTVEDNQGILWFGTYDGGLDRFDRRSHTFEIFRHNPADPHSLSSDSINRIYLDRANTLWIGTSYGLNHFDPNTKRFTFHPLNPRDPPSVRAIAEDQFGAIWAGTFNRGLYRLDPRTGASSQFTASSSLLPRAISDNRVNTLLLDSSGSIWVGTQNGLDRLNPQTQTVTTSYSEHDGLSNNAVQSILQDGRRHLWIGTTRGLSQFDPQTRSFRSYYESDGLAGDEFNFFDAAVTASDGEMFFGGVKGLTAFFPEKVIENTYVPPVVLTDFRLFNVSIAAGVKSPLAKSITVTSSLTLNHSQNIFSFEFSALSFADPQRNRYRYRLEGLETKWNQTDSTRRFVTYTTIPSGRYVFQVQGSNNRGIWNENGVGLHLLILPPWWRRWWFLSLETAVVIGGLWSFYYLRTRAIRRRNRALRYYGDIFNSTDDGIIAATLDGVITAWNRGAERIYGYTAQEMIDRNLSVLAPEELKDEAARGLARLARGEGAIHTETARRRKDGRSIHVSVTVSPIHDERGATVGASVIVSDISDRKQVEEEMKALSEKLINAQEEERTRIARELHDNLSQQIAGISLTVAAAKRKLLQSKTHANDELERIRLQLNNLANATRELSHELHPAMLDYCDLSTALRAHCRDFSSLTGIEVSFFEEGVFSDLDPEVALCLYRVVQEGRQNVAKHAGTGCARVQLVRTGEHANLTISDQGNGFSMEKRRSAAGLGLVSIRERVRLVEGSFDLRSAPNRGTIITLDVPVHSRAHVVEDS